MHLRWLAIFSVFFWIFTISVNAGGSPEAGEAVPRPSPQGQEKQTFLFVPHTHWEGAVFKTREEYLETGLTIILKVLHLLDIYPEYRFALDQVAFVKPFLERYPEQEARFRKFVAEGRLQIVGGSNIMHDNNMPGPESLVHQYLYGKNYFREKLGVDVTVGWELDAFGHNAQMPQILKQSGFKSYWFYRGVPSLEWPSEILWEGIDGSRIPAFWLPHGYGLVYHSPQNFAGFDRFFRSRFNMLNPFSRGTTRPGLAGADVSLPEEHVPRLAREFNAQKDAPFQIRFGVPTDFEAIAAEQGERPVLKGELNPIFQGIYSSRIEVKQRIRELERLLTTWEKLDVLADWLGFPTDHELLVRAWERLLFNQTHDLASGVMVDKVYDDAIRTYHFSKLLADEKIQTQSAALASKIDTRGEGIPIVVFNSLGWPRTDVVQAAVGFVESGVNDLVLRDPEGNTVPVQIERADHNEDGGLRDVRIAFVARDVPAVGYAVYHLTPGEGSGPAEKATGGGPWGVTTAAQQDFGTIENEFYRAKFHLWTGEITSLVDKLQNWEVLGGPGNIVAREKDGGDFWELYGNLHGARNIQMVKKQLLPPPERTEFSNNWVGGSGRTDRGPVFSEYSVTHPFGDGRFATRVRLYNGVPRVEFHTTLFNTEPFVRYRVLFPTSIRNGKNVQEISFGSLERPTEQEYPAQNWIDYGDGKKGVALLNRGLPGNNVADNTLLLSLMRSARINAYAFQGGYEQGVSSDSGLSVGKEFKFQYALYPHSGDWRKAGVYRAGFEFNHPLIAHKAGHHAGVLPKRWGMIEISHPNVVLTAFKPGRDESAVLRVYEANGQATSGVKIKLNAGIAVAYESNLIEDTGAKLKVGNDTLQFNLGPYEIKTLKLKLRPKLGRN